MWNLAILKKLTEITRAWQETEQVEQLLASIESQLSTASKGQLIAKSADILQLALAANKKPMPSFVTAQVSGSCSCSGGCTLVLAFHLSDFRKAVDCKTIKSLFEQVFYSG